MTYETRALRKKCTKSNGKGVQGDIKPKGVSGKSVMGSAMASLCFTGACFIMEIEK